MVSQSRQDSLQHANPAQYSIPAYPNSLGVKNCFVQCSKFEYLTYYSRLILLEYFHLSSQDSSHILSETHQTFLQQCKEYLDQYSILAKENPKLGFNPNYNWESFLQPIINQYINTESIYKYRKELLENLDSILKETQKKKEDKLSGVIPIFDFNLLESL